MTVLKIDSSARLEGANSRVLTEYLAGRIGGEVVERDLAKQALPFISAEDLIGVHGSSNDGRASLQEHLALSNNLIAELKAADTLILGVSMYNFGIPASLKQWVDYICRAGLTFKYTESGPVGLSGIKRAFIVTATGGTPIGSEMDYASRYLELICRFIGVKEIIQIDASGSKGTPEAVIAEAKLQIDKALLESVSEVELGEV